MIELHLLQSDELMQDSFGRVNDKNKEALKIAKHLTKLFPNKVTIQTPQVCHLCYYRATFTFRHCLFQVLTLRNTG